MKLHFLCVIVFVLFHNELSSRPFATICNSLYRKYRATPCSSEPLKNHFLKLQKKIGIKRKVSLFESETLSNECAALYHVLNRSVVINKNFLPSSPRLIQSFILYHELRHHLQNIENPDAINTVYNLTQNAGLTSPQAFEYDADHFGMTHAAQNCIPCLQCLKETTDSIRKSKNWKGYFTKLDYDKAIIEAAKNPTLCRKHKNF